MLAPAVPSGLGLNVSHMPLQSSHSFPKHHHPAQSVSSSQTHLMSTANSEWAGDPNTSKATVIPARHVVPQSLQKTEALCLATTRGPTRMTAFDRGNRDGTSHFQGSAKVTLNAATSRSGALNHDQLDTEHYDVLPNRLPTCNTLLDIGPSAATYHSAGLKTLLGDSNARLRSRAKMASTANRVQGCDSVSLEQARQRARVEADIILESATCVQGGYLRGQMKVRIRGRSRKEDPILLAEGKLRLVGFEAISDADEYHVFYQCAAPFSKITNTSQGLYATSPDPEGYAQAAEGIHIMPFVMKLPLGNAFGVPKGVLDVSSGIAVRYVAMISIRIKDGGSGKCSIAHFYRDCEVWPILESSSILATAPRLLQASTARGLSVLGVKSHDKVRLTANICRLHWVAGQRCYVRVLVNNGSKKMIKQLALALIRTVTIFRPKPTLGFGPSTSTDPDACQTSTTHKLVAESVLEMSLRGARRHASAKGWWTGVKPGCDLEFTQHILLPPTALSVTRGHLLEVEYSIRVTLSAGSLTPDIFVTLPIRIINFLSIDPSSNSCLLSPNSAYIRTITNPSQRKDFAGCSDVPASTHSNPSEHSVRSTHSYKNSTIRPGDMDQTADGSISRPHLSSFVPTETYLSPRLQVTNPDPPTNSDSDTEIGSVSSAQANEETPIALQIRSSLSEASVYSTSSYFSGITSYDSRLDSFECRSDGRSHIGLVSILEPGQKQPPKSSCQNDLDEFDRVFLPDRNHNRERLDDEKYSSRVSSDSEASSTDVSRMNFASRVQEKLAARVQKTANVIPPLEASETDYLDEAVTPRIQRSTATDEHEATHNLNFPSTTASQSFTSSVKLRSSPHRTPSSVRGPRRSRQLPRPPTSPLVASLAPNGHDISASDSMITMPQINSPSDVIRLTGESVKNRVAALEQRVRDAEDSGDAYI